MPDTLVTFDGTAALFSHRPTAERNGTRELGGGRHRHRRPDPVDAVVVELQQIQARRFDGERRCFQGDARSGREVSCYVLLELVKLKFEAAVTPQPTPVTTPFMAKFVVPDSVPTTEL